MRLRVLQRVIQRRTRVSDSSLPTPLAHSCTIDVPTSINHMSAHLCLTFFLYVLTRFSANQSLRFFNAQLDVAHTDMHLGTSNDDEPILSCPKQQVPSTQCRNWYFRLNHADLVPFCYHAASDSELAESCGNHCEDGDLFRDADEDEDDTETASVTPGGSPRAASTVSPALEAAASPLLPPFDPPPDDETPDGELSETVALTYGLQFISD